MGSRRVETSMPYSRAQLFSLLGWAQKHDVHAGGRYDAAAAAITVWTHPWTTPKEKAASLLMGTFYLSWNDDNRIIGIDIEDGFTLAGMMHELKMLEEKALGKPVHGR